MNDAHPHLVPVPSPSAAPGLEQGDDDQLMLLAAGGSQAAFEVLVGRTLPKLTKYCARFVGCASIAEELAQEILLEVWLRRSQYRPAGKFTVFLFTLARHRCLNRLRDDQRRHARDQHAQPDGLNQGATPPGQLDALLEQERQRRLRQALLTLSPKLREAVLLRFDQGLDYPEVARILGCSESTTRSRVRLAMQSLREELSGGFVP